MLNSTNSPVIICICVVNSICTNITEASSIWVHICCDKIATKHLNLKKKNIYIPSLGWIIWTQWTIKSIRRLTFRWTIIWTTGRTKKASHFNPIISLVWIATKAWGVTNIVQLLLLATCYMLLIVIWSFLYDTFHMILLIWILWLLSKNGFLSLL